MASSCGSGPEPFSAFSHRHFLLFRAKSPLYNMYHPAPAVKRDDFGHVETHRLVALMGALEIPCGGCDDTALLGGVDRRVDELAGGPGDAGGDAGDDVQADLAPVHACEPVPDGAHDGGDLADVAPHWGAWIEITC